MAAQPQYNSTVQGYFDTPQRVGTLVSGSNPVLTGRAGSRETGAVIEFQLLISDGKVADTRYRVYGCPHTVAMTAWLADTLVGQDPRQLRSVGPQDMAVSVDLPPHKMRHALTIEDALKVCLAPLADDSVA